MRKNNKFGYRKSILFMVMLFSLISPVMAQVDTTAKAVQSDTSNPMKVDTTARAVQADTSTNTQGTQEKKKKKREFIIYTGANLNQLNTSSDKFETTSSFGYHFGVAYKQGRFFYWQAGARYNNAQYNFVDKATHLDSSKLTVRAIDLPLTVGVNFLSFVNKLVAVRAFVSGVPSFTLGVGDNNLNFTKDNLNSFVFYGQAGIGVNVTLLVIEVGYNYGFHDLLKGYSSTPGQAFLSLGVRF